MTIQCVTDPDLAGFFKDVSPWLLRDPVRNNVAYTVMSQRLDGLTPLEPDATWMRVLGGDGELAGVGWWTPPHTFGLVPMPSDAAVALAEHAVSLALPGVGGPVHVAGLFARRYATRTGVNATVSCRTRLLRLETVVPPARVPGRCREASLDDRELLIDWWISYNEELFPGEAHVNAAVLVNSRLRTGERIWVWEHAGHLVAMNMLSPMVAGVPRISGVYTPPPLRGNGYASALVAATSRYALDQGAKAIMLYTDQANPISNKIYQRIGYQPVADACDWVFTK